MARIRTIKPDFWTDEKLTECSLSARLLFIGTWNFADDNGNLQASAKKLKMQIFPADNIDCKPLLDELITQGLIIEYSVSSEKFLHIKNFKKHQVINRPSSSSIPPLLLSEGSLTEGKGEEGKGREGKGEEGDAPANSSIEEEKRKRVAESCLALKKHGVLDFSSINPNFIKLIDLGVTADEFEDCAKSAKQKKFNYIVQMVSGRREDANNLILAEKKSSKPSWLKV